MSCDAFTAPRYDTTMETGSAFATPATVESAVKMSARVEGAATQRWVLVTAVTKEGEETGVMLTVVQVGAKTAQVTAPVTRSRASAHATVAGVTGAATDPLALTTATSEVTALLREINQHVAVNLATLAMLVNTSVSTVPSQITNVSVRPAFLDHSAAPSALGLAAALTTEPATVVLTEEEETTVSYQAVQDLVLTAVTEARATRRLESVCVWRAGRGGDVSCLTALTTATIVESVTAQWITPCAGTAMKGGWAWPVRYPVTAPKYLWTVGSVSVPASVSMARAVSR